MTVDQHRLAPLFLLFCVVACVTGCLLLLRPPAPLDASVGPGKFSAVRAREHLRVIASAPHSSGTSAHAKVREYIVAYCRHMGLDTKVMEGTGLRAVGAYVNAGHSRNVMAVLPGTDRNRKSILVMGHYDSQPNTPGAADNGAAVAAMMESIRALKHHGPLKNDVVFLFTDLEEVGLLGAESFRAQYGTIEDIGLVLNFESRGNSGAAFTFEVSPDNGWLIGEFAKAVEYPYANSLAYEIYKRMPNDSDFTMFRDLKAPGLNSAFIDGYSHYHSMTDSPENIDLGSVQHHGSLMLGMLLHFGHRTLVQGTQGDCIFFNPVGSWLLSYPYAWDLPFLLLSIGLFLTALGMGLFQGRLLPKQLFIGAGLFLLSALAALLFTWLLRFIILWAYPHYSNFYNHNFYNAGDYLPAFLGCCLLGLGIVFHRAVRCYEPESLSLGAFALMVPLAIVLKSTLGTGAFIVYVPMVFFSAVYLIYFLSGIQWEKDPWLYGIGQALALLPALGLWITFVVNLFIVFSLALPYAAVFFILLFFPLLIPLMAMLAQLHHYSFSFVALFFLGAGLLLGQYHAAPTRERPLQVALMYAVDHDAQRALWVCSDAYLPPWARAHVAPDERRPFGMFGTNDVHKAWLGEAEMKPYTIGHVEVLRDSLTAQGRFVDIVLFPAAGTLSLDLRFSHTVRLRAINERFLASTDKGMPLRQLRYSGIPRKGRRSLQLQWVVEKNAVPTITLIERSLGIPEEYFRETMPENIVHGTGLKSNSLQVKRILKW